MELNARGIDDCGCQPGPGELSRRGLLRLGLLGLVGIPLAGLPFQRAQAAEAAAENMLVNGGFEQVNNGLPVAWSVYDGQVASTQEQVRNGAWAVKVTDDTSLDGAGLRSDHIIVDNRTNPFQAEAYSFNLSGNSYLFLEFWGSDGQRIHFVNAPNQVLGQWERLTVRAFAPEAAVTCTVMVYSSAANVGVAYFDDASLVQNLLVNGGFEEVDSSLPVAWTVANGRVASTEEQVRSGVWAVKVTDDTSLDGAGLRSDPIVVDSNQIYPFQANVYSFNLSGNSYLFLEFWGSDGQRIHFVNAPNQVLGQWERLTVRAFAPEAAVTCTVMVYSSAANVGVAYFDDASLVVAPPDDVREFPLLVAGHPRLYFTAEQIADLQAKAADDTPTVLGLTGRQLWERVRADADQYLAETSFTIGYQAGIEVTYPLPPEQPGPIEPPPGFHHYPYWTLMGRALEERLETLSLAYVISENQEYGQRAKDYALALADWEAWTDPTYSCTDGAFSCLDTCHLTLGVSAAYDIVYDLLTVDERGRLASALETKGLISLYRDTQTMHDNNYGMLRHTALGVGGAVVLGTSDNANGYLTNAANYFSWYLDRRLNSGDNEGFLYTSYSSDNMLRAVDHIERTTGVQEWRSHPFLDDFLVRWILYFLAPGGNSLAAFSDSSPVTYFFLTMGVLGSGHGNWYLQEALPAPGTDFDGFIYAPAGTDVTPPDDLPPSAVLNEIGLAALRSGWAEHDVLLAFLSNDSAASTGHNHFDQNSFQVATNNTWIASDPGYQDYTPGPTQEFTTRMGHSTIQVDGQGQSSKGGGHITPGLLSPSTDYVKGTAAGAYTDPELTRFDRHVVFVRPHYFVLLDDLVATSPHSYDWILYSGGGSRYMVDGSEVAIGDTTTGRALWIQRGGAQVTARFLAAGALSMTPELYPGAEGYGPYVRVSSGDPESVGRFLTVLQAAPYIRPGFVEAEALLPAAASSGKEVKLVSVAGASLVFYRATAPGDYLTLRVRVAQAGTHTLRIWFGNSSVYGRVQVAVDGETIGPVVDTYNATTQVAPPLTLGDVQLSAGDHDIRFEVVGKNAESTNYFFSIDALQLFPAGTPADPTPLAPLDGNLLEGASAVGAQVNRGGADDITDLIVFGDPTQSTELAGISANGAQMLVGYDDNGRIERYSLTTGTTLEFGGRSLLTSTVQCNASMVYDAANQVGEGIAELEADGGISIYSRPSESVEVDGEVLGPDDYDYDSATCLLTLTLTAGRHVIRVTGPDMSQPATCLEPDERETVVVGGVDSGVPNGVTANGCTINDLIDDEKQWDSSASFMRHLGEVLDSLVAGNVIDARERSSIRRAGARSDVGRGR